MSAVPAVKEEFEEALSIVTAAKAQSSASMKIFSCRSETFSVRRRLDNQTLQSFSASQSGVHVMSTTLARSLASVLVLTILSAVLAAGPRAGDKKPPAKARNVVKGKAAEELVLLKLEVDALEKLYHLELNARQLPAMLALAEKTAAKMPETKEVQAGEEYRNVLKSLHDALLSQEEERIRELSDKLGELQEKETLSIEDAFDMTDAAMAAAPQAFRLLSAAQIIAYLSALDDEVPDPAERILSALEEGAEAKDDEWKQLRDETAEEVAWLAASFKTESTARVKSSVIAFLDRNHRFKGEELTKHWPALEKDAHNLVRNVTSLMVLQHYMERELAELLSNPRAATAIRSWMKKSKE
jgi:hypothetical protein